jgi:hypothetical protein
VFRLLEALEAFRHAVAAAQVAAVRHRQPHVVDAAAELVGEAGLIGWNGCVHGGAWQERVIYEKI